MSRFPSLQMAQPRGRSLRFGVLLALGVWTGWLSAAAAAQPIATLRVEVMDVTESVVPGAEVVLTAPGGAPLRATTAGDGAAVFRVPPGDYRLQVAMPGFEPHDDALTVGRGRQTARVTLAVAGLQESLIVQGPDRALFELETVLEPEELAALPDDPDALTEALLELAGPDGAIVVDGFEGRRVPSREQIAAVTIRSDPFSAEFHRPGRRRVEVTTKPGVGRWQGGGGISYRPSALGARNPFSPEAVQDRNGRGRLTVLGPLAAGRSSVAFEASTSHQLLQRPALALTGEGVVRDIVPQTRFRHDFEGRMDLLFASGAILRLQAETERGGRRGAGIGDTDLPERAYEVDEDEHRLRLSYRRDRPAGVSQDLRLQIGHSQTRTVSDTDGVTIDVQGAFRAGGAQRAGDRRETTVDLAANWDLWRTAPRRLKAGVLLQAIQARSSERRNWLGTFVFPGLEAYLAGRPSTFTQQVGAVDVRHADVRFGGFVETSLRLSPALLLNAGLRQEWQSAAGDPVNLAPRLTLVWSRGRDTSVRLNAGRFYDWLAASVREEALRVDGRDVREITIQDPGYPDPFTGGRQRDAAPPGRLLIAEDLVLASAWRMSASVEHRVHPQLTLRAVGSREIGRDEPRSRNLNAPLLGVRPDPTLGNVWLIHPAGRSEQTSLELDARLTSPGRRASTGVRYTLGRRLNDGEGPLALPVDNDHLAAEWGPANSDRRHRISVPLRVDFGGGLTGSLSWRWLSAPPYTITTGRDDNADTVSNDRPPGVGRNSARGAASSHMNLRLTWTRPLGSSATGGGRDQQGPRLRMYVNARNLLNEPQFGRFVGVLGSPLFGQPASGGDPRRIEVGANVSF